MTQHDRTEIAREIAAMLPDKKRWWLLRSLAIGIVTAMTTTVSVTIAINNQYHRMWNAINEGNRASSEAKQVATEAKQLAAEARQEEEHNKERILLCCPALYQNQALLTQNK